MLPAKHLYTLCMLNGSLLNDFFYLSNMQEDVDVFDFELASDSIPNSRW